MMEASLVRPGCVGRSVARRVASLRFVSSPTCRVASPCLPCLIFFLTSSSMPFRLVISFEQLSTGITPSVGPPPLESGRDGTPRSDGHAQGW
jgi:hypothetical protein